MKFFVISKCRLVDKNMYLLPGQIFDPESEEYERASRSLAAALRSGWVRKATPQEIEKYSSTQKVASPKPTQPQQSKLAKDAALGAVDMKPESFADEVISGEDILKARDKRRAEATVKTVPDVDVVSEDSQQTEESNDSEVKDEPVDTTEETETSEEADLVEETPDETATDIKKEIEKKIRKKTSRKRKS